VSLKFNVLDYVIQFKREAVKDQRKAVATFKKKLAQKAKARKAYRQKHPKNYKGKKRGRKPTRLNERFVPEELSNGDTKVELLTRKFATAPAFR
jgi:hypothetical protein